MSSALCGDLQQKAAAICMSATALPNLSSRVTGIRLAGRPGNDALRSVPRSHQRRRGRADTGKFAPDANYYPSDLRSRLD
jgi:hypothetical protein